MFDMEIREICGDYALDLKYPDETIVIYFNSYQNALNVKRIIEVDRSVPNAATVADFVEVVRCKDCKCYELMKSTNQHFCNKYGGYVNENDYCSRCKRRDTDEK